MVYGKLYEYEYVDVRSAHYSGSLKPQEAGKMNLIASLQLF
jgi:hypothetical protein